jgi:hypothetical protein
MQTLNPVLTAATPKQLLLKTFGIVAFISALSIAAITKAATLDPASTHSVTLAWDAAPESVVTGYRVSIGTSSGQYTQTQEGGLATQMTLGGLEFGQTYHAIVTSLGDGGVESEPSTELSFTVQPPPLPLGAQVAFNASGQGMLQWNFPVAALTSSPEFIIQSSPDLINWTVVETVSADQPGVEEGGLMNFVWPLPVMGSQMFYRLTARNWMGESTGP